MSRRGAVRRGARVNQLNAESFISLVCLQQIHDSGAWPPFTLVNVGLAWHLVFVVIGRHLPALRVRRQGPVEIRKNIIESTLKWTLLTQEYQQKARCCARGDHQKYMEDYLDTYSPVAQLQPIRLLLAIVIHKHMKTRQFDIPTAFVRAPIDKEIYR